MKMKMEMENGKWKGQKMFLIKKKEKFADLLKKCQKKYFKK